MKPRNREINIFNMSLLDVLCGALGAFCFLTLVLFPYYTPNKSDSKAPDVPPGVDPKSLEDAKARIQELEATLKKFQDYAAQLEAQNKQLQARNQQLQQQAQQTGQKMDQYQMRNPFLATMDLKVSPDDDLELYIEDSARVTRENNTPTPKADLHRRQGNFWGGDLAAMTGDGSMGYFMVRDAPPGEYRVVLKVMKHNPSGPPIAGTVMIDTNKNITWIGIANLNKDQVVIPIASVQVDADYKETVQRLIPQEYFVAAPHPKMAEAAQPANQKKN